MISGNDSLHSVNCEGNTIGFECDFKRKRSSVVVNGETYSKPWKLPDGKYKTSKKINDIPNVIHDKSYGIVKKICKITYSRSYLSNGKIRLTLDSNLKFENLINRYVFNMNNNIILEYKILDDFSSSENYINSHKELNSFKFSKYEQAISKVINFKV